MNLFIFFLSMTKYKKIAREEIENLLEEPVQTAHLSSIQNLVRISHFDRQRYQIVTKLLTQCFCADVAGLVLSSLELRAQKLTCALVRQIRGIKPTRPVTLREYLEEGVPLWDNVFSNVRKCEGYLRTQDPMIVHSGGLAGLEIVFLMRPMHSHRPIYWEVLNGQAVLVDWDNQKPMWKVTCDYTIRQTWQLRVSFPGKLTQLWEANSLGEALKKYILSR